MIEYQTESGTVVLDRSVFAMIALKSAGEQQGFYAVTNARGKVIKSRSEFTGRENLSFIEVSRNEDSGGVDIRIYVVMKFGMSILRTAREYGMRTREYIREITGVEASGMTVAVTGIKSKNIAPRELEIQC